jgi:RNA polymerase sigma factor (sigma-70 family)
MDVEALFNQHQTALLRYLLRYTGDPDAAADAAQETYLTLIERPPQSQENVRAWLFSVATNVVRQNRRKRREVALAPNEVAQIPLVDSAPNALAALELDEKRNAVRGIVAKLSAKERTVLLMREEGFTHREIAGAVGTTTKSIGTMIDRALQKLASYLGETPEEFE